MIFDAIKKKGESYVMLSALLLKQRILSSPEKHFMVPNVWPRKKEEPDSELDIRCGVIALSKESLQDLRSLCYVPSKYVFQVVYFWATGHKVAVRKEEPSDLFGFLNWERAKLGTSGACPADEKPSGLVVSDLSDLEDRWRHAQEFMSRKSFLGVDPQFLTCVAEPSGLLSHDILYRAYRRAALDGVK